jgi:hypothetical protein
MYKYLFLKGIYLIVWSGSWAGVCHAQPNYPTRTVRIVVPYPPGGGNDIIARAYADELTRRLAQQVIIDNRPGGSTIIGAELVAKAPPDGYTLLVSSHTTFAIVPNIRAKLPYDVVRDFEPVAPARRHQRAAFAPCSADAHHRRERCAGLRHARMECNGRAAPDKQRHHRTVERRDYGNHKVAGSARAPRRTRL